MLRTPLTVGESCWLAAPVRRGIQTHPAALLLQRSMIQRVKLRTFSVGIPGVVAVVNA